MLPPSRKPPFEHLSVVLVRARNPNNIGAVARAMYNFGFRDLRVVSDHPPSLEEARSAVDAAPILRAAREYESLSDAVADSHLVVGTTAGGRRVQEHPLHPLSEGAKLIRQSITGDQRVALLFGSEKTGLSREELSHCHWTMTIPMYPWAGVRHPSMNLGQAAAVCFYEIAQTESAPDPSLAAGQPATGEERERLLGLLRDTLEAGEYFASHPAHREDEDLRRLLHRMSLNSEDSATWMGILRQLLWKIKDR